jgi:hypothetical protein
MRLTAAMIQFAEYCRLSAPVGSALSPLGDIQPDQWLPEYGARVTTRQRLAPYRDELTSEEAPELHRSPQVPV